MWANQLLQCHIWCLKTPKNWVLDSLWHWTSLSQFYTNTATTHLWLVFFLLASLWWWTPHFILATDPEKAMLDFFTLLDKVSTSVAMDSLNPVAVLWGRRVTAVAGWAPCDIRHPGRSARKRPIKICFVLVLVSTTWKSAQQADFWKQVLSNHENWDLLNLVVF